MQFREREERRRDQVLAELLPQEWFRKRPTSRTGTPGIFGLKIQSQWCAYAKISITTHVYQKSMAYENHYSRFMYVLKSLILALLLEYKNAMTL